MALTEKTVLSQVTTLPEQGAVNVRWDNIIERDGVEISRQPHRKAYTADQRAEFEAEVAGAASYIEALGWGA